MADLKRTGMGLGVFFLCYILVFVLQWLLPPLLSIFDDLTNGGTTFQSIGWFALGLLSVIGFLVVPLLF